MKETTAKPWIADGNFKTGRKPPLPRREGGATALRKPKVGDRKIILK